MAAAAVVAPDGPARPERSVRLLGRRYPVLLPSIRDPRLHVAACLLTVQVLGQTVLDFELSIAQILLSLGTCAVLEVGITMWNEKVIAWPASALLTGNGVALLLRTTGTEPGEWWSLDGWHIWLAAASVSLLSKYVIRYRGQHVFNPSNLGLVLIFVIVGTLDANPQDLWWGDLDAGLVLTYAVIIVGGTLVVRRLGLLAAAATFWVSFAAGVGIVALSGHAMTARWKVGPVEGFTYWSVLVTSPEILIFLYFMITDPRTAPVGRVARVVYAAAVGWLAALLGGAFGTEFSTKVATIGALVVVCGLRPFVEQALPAAGSEADRVRSWLAPRRLALAAGTVAAAALVLGVSVLAPEPELPPVAAAGRPEVDLPAGAVPEVAVGDGTDTVAASFSPAAVEAMATDLVEGLAIEADARRTGEVDLAATALTGERLAEARRAIESGEPVPVEEHTFTELTLVVTRDGTSPQARPLVAFEARGTVRTTVGAGEGTEEPFAGTFTLRPGGQHQLVAAYDPA